MLENNEFTMFQIIETERLLLRKLNTDDIQDIYEKFSSEYNFKL